jgi:hypothetical protein
MLDYCPGISKTNKIQNKGEYKKLTEPYKGFSSDVWNESGLIKR